MQSSNTSTPRADLPQARIKTTNQALHAWILNSPDTIGISSNAHHLGIFLLRATNPRAHNGEFRAWHKYATLANAIGKSVSTIARCVAELRDKGIITTEKPKTARPTNLIMVFEQQALDRLASQQVDQVAPVTEVQTCQSDIADMSDRHVSNVDEEDTRKKKARGKRESASQTQKKSARFDEGEFFRLHFEMTAAQRQAEYTKLRSQRKYVQKKCGSTRNIDVKMDLIDCAEDARNDPHPTYKIRKLLKEHIDSNRPNTSRSPTQHRGTP